MKIYEHLQKQMIVDNFLNSLDFISRYGVFEDFFQNLENIYHMDAQFQVRSMKKQQVLQYYFSSLETLETILAHFFIQDGCFKRCELHFQDENGIGSDMDIQVLSYGIVKVKKEYMIDEERILEEQYYSGNILLTSKKWKFNVKNKPYLSTAYFYDLDRSCVFLRNYETDERSIVDCRYIIRPSDVKGFFKNYEIPSNIIGIYKVSNGLSKTQFEKQSLGIYRKVRRIGRKNSSPN